MLLVPPARSIPEGMFLVGNPKIKSQSFRQFVKVISERLLSAFGEKPRSLTSKFFNLFI